MLNLVQLQERLKDVPMQALMQYANGGNPQVPPFLALGELNRRKKMQEGAAAQQAQAMEGAPTVKQQIEQAAGLMALQGNRQKQAAQQQAGIQAALPMAAPNTTTSEPAQMAGGGFIDDVVVPRDYAVGGQIDPEKLKQEMFSEAMRGDVANIPKELLLAAKKSALRGAPGISSLQLPKDMFRRSDYAGGGIVAFNGATNGSFVEQSPGFYQLKEELPEDEQAKSEMESMPAEIRQMMRIAKQIKERSSPEAITARRKAAGLPTLASELPDTSARTLEELQRQKQALDESDTFASRLLALTPGRRFGTGETGKGLLAYEKERMAKGSELSRAIATVQDLREKAKMDFAENRFKEGETAMAAADKIEMTLAEKVPEAMYKHKLGEREKTSNLTYMTQVIDEARRNPTPENIRRMQSVIEAAQYTAPLAGPRIESQGDIARQQIDATNARDALESTRKMLTIEGLVSNRDLASRLNQARKDDPSGVTERQIKLDVLNQNRASQNPPLPPLRQLPADLIAPGKTSAASSQAAPQQAPATGGLPPQAVSQLKEGTITTFANGQKWTIKDGKPQQVQ